MGASVEAVDHLGIWSNTKIVSKSEKTVVVTFPPGLNKIINIKNVGTDLNRSEVVMYLCHEETTSLAIKNLIINAVTE